MSNNANVAAAIKEVAHKVFGGYAELLRMPHTARFSIGSVIACMPFPMVGMTITISVQHYYGNYSLAGVLTAIQAIALAVSSPLLGKLVDKFGQRQVSIPTHLSRPWATATPAVPVGARRRHRPDHQHHQPRPGMGAVLPDAVPRRDSAVGRDEPRPLDDHAQGRPGAHRPRALAVRCVR